MSHTGSVRPVRRVFVLLTVTAVLLTSVAVAPASAQGSRSPSGLAAQIVNDQVVLTWTAGTHPRASGQRIVRRQGKAGWVTVADVAANAVTYTDTTVASDRKYIYRVQNLIGGRPRGGVSNRAVASLGTVRVQVRVLDPTGSQDPTGLSARVDGGAVVLTWTAGTDSRTTTQRVIRRAPKGAWVPFTVARNATTYRDVTAESGQRYIYRVESRAGDRAIGVSARLVVRVP